MVLTGTGDDDRVVFELLGAPGHLLYLISYGKVPGSHLAGLGVLGVPGDGPDRSEVPFRRKAGQLPVFVRISPSHCFSGFDSFLNN